MVSDKGRPERSRRPFFAEGQGEQALKWKDMVREKIAG
jgi:hypothetical protein